jgi:penicillin amidase
VLAVRWTGQEATNEREALLEVNHAGDFDAFAAALEKVGSPAQNVVYADVDGNIGYVLAGKIPIRRNGRGTTPVPGWIEPGPDDFEWTGFIPYDRQPKLFNPEEGLIATANQKSATDDYPFYISSYWEPPFRIRRIHQRLAETERHTVETMKSIQNDVHSLEAEDFCRDVIGPWMERLDQTEIRGAEEPAIRGALDTLRRWDFRCTTDSRAAAIYHALFERLLHEVFEPTLGEDLWLLLFENWNEALVSAEKVIRDPMSGWIAERRIDDLLLRSLSKALRLLAERLGSDPAGWTWGRLHTLTLPHPLGAHPVLGPALNLGPYPSQGTSFTVNNGQFFYAYPFKHVAGPGLRQIVDLSDPERSIFIVNAGQSSNLASPHHADLTALWRRGEYVPMTLDAAGVTKLTLRPGGTRTP